MKKLIPLFFLLTSLSAFATDTYSTSDGTLFIPEVVIDEKSSLYEVTLRFDISTGTFEIGSFKHSPTMSDSYVINNAYISDFNGLKPGWLFILQNGAVWKMSDLEVKSVPYTAENRLAIFKSYGKFYMLMANKNYSVEPYLFKVMYGATLESKLSKYVFSDSRGHTWRSKEEIPFILSSPFTIIDDVLIFSGTNYKVESLDY